MFVDRRVKVRGARIRFLNVRNVEKKLEVNIDE